MSDLPTEILGLPLGALIIGAVEALKRAGLPDQYAGIAAIVLGTAIGGGYLIAVSNKPIAVALAEGVALGLATVASQYSTVRPLVKSLAAPSPVVLNEPALPKTAG